MYGHSVFDYLLSVKNRVLTSSNNQLQLLQQLSNGILTDIDSDLHEFRNTNITPQITSTIEGVAIEISKSADSYDLVLNTINDVNATVESFTIDARDITVDNIAQNLSETTNTSLNSILSSLSSSENLNETIGTISDQFLTKVNVDFTVLDRIIDNMSGVKNFDITKLKTLIQANVSDGKLSNYAWANIVSTMCERGKEATDDDSLQIQSEDFYSFQNFMNTIISGISFIFSLICTTLGTIFGSLFYAIGNIISYIPQLISNTFDTEYEFLGISAYPGIKGTTFSGQLSSLGRNTFQFSSRFTDEMNNKAIRFDYGSEDVFMIRQKDENNHIKASVQCQMKLSYDPDRFIDYIRSIFQTTEYSGKIGVELINPAIDPYMPWGNQSLALTADEYAKAYTDMNYLTNCTKISIIASMLNHLPCTDMNIMSNFSRDYPQLAYAIIGTSSSSNHPIAQAIQFVNACMSGHDAGLAWLNSSSHLDGTAIRNLRDDFNLLMNGPILGGDPLYIQIDSNGYYGLLCRTILPNCYPSLNPNTLYSTCALSGSQWVWLLNSNYLSDDSNILDNIPTDDVIKLPSFSGAEAILITGAAVIIMATMTMFTKKLVKNIKAKAQIKASARRNELNKLLDNAAKAENPAEKRAATAAYTKAINKYNKRAKLFGWPSYDATNQWFNYDDSSSGAMDNNVSSMLLQSDLSDLTQLITR